MRLPLAVLCSAAFATPGTAQPMFDVPKAVKPDADVLAKIAAQTAELQKALAALPKATPGDVRADVEVYLKAAEWIVRHGEWFTKESPAQTLAVLDAGLARAKAAADGKTPWRDVRGKPVVRGYRSRVDGSVQPVSINMPDGYGEKGKTFRTDIVLHGRDGSLTEVKFIAGKEAAKAGKPPAGIVIEPYGRGNNAYRWAGETDVLQSAGVAEDGIDPSRLVLRGFSMGGAGTWHLGLHHPAEFAVIGPGAGFSTTRGYVGKLPEKLPFDQDKLLHIYDAVDYAENVFNVPVVAYSGEEDGQKAAADNIENALKNFQEKVRFTHLIAPKLKHQMPAEWQAKAEAEYKKYVEPGRKTPDRIRFVTYTTKFSRCDWVEIRGLDEHYRRAVIDAKTTADAVTVATENVQTFELHRLDLAHRSLVIDGQMLPRIEGAAVYRKQNGKWARVAAKADRPVPAGPLSKVPNLQGPIDDAFTSAFAVVAPAGKGWHEATATHADGSLKRFAAEWDKFLRGKLPTTPTDDANLVLFGDPQSNPTIAKVLPKLPITWTKEKLTVNGVEYDAKTHVPVMIYPNPLNPGKYVVLNSGHTFHADAFQGTNALLYPRLGDWAVLKVAPTDKDPAAAEVVAAGLFDEFWQFKKK